MTIKQLREKRAAILSQMDDERDRHGEPFMSTTIALYKVCDELADLAVAQLAKGRDERRARGPRWI